MSISSKRNIFYTLKQHWFFLISFYSFEGVRYFWVELFVFFYKLRSTTNQQLFCVTESDIGQGPLILNPSMNYCLQYCDLHWALVKFLTLNRLLLARNDSSNCYIVMFFSSFFWLVSFDQFHILNWRKLKKLIGKCFPKQHVDLQKPKKLKKNLRKSQASNAWATIFKNVDFS